LPDLRKAEGSPNNRAWEPGLLVSDMSWEPDLLDT
jgi:hypothetical protein